MQHLLETQWIRVFVWASLLLLVAVVVVEGWRPKFLEGFAATEESTGGSAFWTKLVPRRGDVGPELEVAGLTRDPRYFVGYADLQRFGIKSDFCRIVQEGDDPKNVFFACALGGAENTSSTAYRTNSVKEGLLLSRDDYMRDTNGDGRDDYCRILKVNNKFDCYCNLAEDLSFDTDLVLDPSPPDDIGLLLKFYQGAMFWLRFYDDMNDYAQNLILTAAGEAAVREKPVKPVKTDGLKLNGVDQFLRIGDDRTLRLGQKVLLRQMRAFSFWVKFDEFTNNARVFDFGNGAGNDNVFVSIVGRGNQGLEVQKPQSICAGLESTLPASPSGQQPVDEVHPQRLMKTTCANVDDFDCKAPAVEPVGRNKKSGAIEVGQNADMLYEIWEGKTRKLHIVLQNAFELGQWTHICVTVGNNNAFRPDIHIYKNGKLAFVQPNGWLPSVSNVASNFIGKSNWSNIVSQYADQDELLKGSLFDFRGYNVRLSSSLSRRRSIGVVPN